MNSEKYDELLILFNRVITLELRRQRLERDQERTLRRIRELEEEMGIHGS